MAQIAIEINRNGRIIFESTSHAEQLMEMAIGRVFLMGGRPTQGGDAETYELCKSICFDAAEYLEMETVYSRGYNHSGTIRKYF